MINYSATYTDLYQITMAQAYFLQGKKKHQAIFDYYFRKIPFEGGYAVFGGLDTLIETLENLSFDESDLEFLKKNGFKSEFLEYLRTFSFHGIIRSSPEGDLIFPTRPILQVEGNIIEAQLIETILLNILNFQTLIATKASRMRLVAGDGKLIDFGLRRSQGPAGYYASRAAVVGGFDGTSNVRAGRDFDIAISGTMAHSFIQSYDDELTAFRDFAKGHPENCVLLVDTYDTLNSGVPNAITVAKEMEARGNRLMGIRLDSGDLAYMGKKSRKMLDDAGLNYVKIAASNQLDEHVIRSLREQKAPIDIFGVGTNLVIGAPDGALDGIYKLAFTNGKPRIKISESKQKTTIPHAKQVYRVRDKDNCLIGADVIAIQDQPDFNKMIDPFDPDRMMAFKDHFKEPLLREVMKNGKRCTERKSPGAINTYCQERLSELPMEYKRFDYPHIYKIGISEALHRERTALINQYKEV